VRGAPDWAVKRRVVALAEQRFARGDAPSLYRFVEEGRSIELHPRGQAYLHHNLAIVTGFCLWSLVTSLPRNNPTVAGKLAEPGPRELGAALAVQGPLRCVDSGEVRGGGRHR